MRDLKPASPSQRTTPHKPTKSKSLLDFESPLGIYGPAIPTDTVYQQEMAQDYWEHDNIKIMFQANITLLIDILVWLNETLQNILQVSCDEYHTQKVHNIITTYEQKYEKYCNLHSTLVCCKKKQEKPSIGILFTPTGYKRNLFYDWGLCFYGNRTH